ncbi:MAG: MarR family transcriptional regulator [Pseudonocardia sp.]|nr:MarR family transcriptional regulator [Pseudonocardia sp.]
MTAETDTPRDTPTGPGTTDPAGALVPEDEADDRLTDEATRLRLAVGRLHRRIRIDGRESVPPLQLSALATIDMHGPLRLSDLAKREAVTAPTMSRVLAALDENGLVVRAADPQDARGVLITLSDKGRAELDSIRTHRTALVARRLGRLDQTQRAALRAALPAIEALLVDDA